MASNTESGNVTGTQDNVTGTQDKDYNIIRFTEPCLNNALPSRPTSLMPSGEGDSELADFFRKAQQESRKGGEQGKQLLARRLNG